ILAFAKQGSTPRLRVNPGTLVRRAVELARSYNRIGNLEFSLQIDENSSLLDVSAAEFEQVFVNLIQNASDAGDGQPVKLSISAKREADFMAIRFHDNGPGIAEENLPHIFDPFFSTRKHVGGTGLGLSICHGIVLSHGGTIDVASKVGDGTTFTIK